MGIARYVADPVCVFGVGVGVAVVALAVSLSAACTRPQLTTMETAADQAAAAGCELIFVPVDPALAPLCVGIADVVAAGAALGLDLLGAAGPSGEAGVVDGGTAAMGARVQQPVVRDPATNARVYDWLVAHGAVKLGG